MRKILAFCILLFCTQHGWAADRFSFLVPKASIATGEPISQDKLEQKYFYIKAGAAGRYVQSLQQVKDKVARRILVRGQPILLSAIERPPLITRGQTVRLQFSSAQLQITARGIALDTGWQGDHIKVRNSDSGRVVTGKIMEDASVWVQL